MPLLKSNSETAKYSQKVSETDILLSLKYFLVGL